MQVCYKIQFRNIYISNYFFSFMLYLVGLGLNEKSISVDALEVVKRCKRVYIENYTVDFPYSPNITIEMIDKKVIMADRNKVEDLSLIDEARKMDVALLVYGNPLTATTHITLVEEAKAEGVKVKIFQNASIFDAVAETGLQLYKFGKVTSMPKWQKSFEPDSFIDVVKENQSIDAHSLILIDIGLEFSDAIKQLNAAAKNKEFEIRNVVICQALGTRKKRIIYSPISELEGFNRIMLPYCIIIPSKKLHHLEKESLEKFRPKDER
jgi:diphthine synthase